MKHIAFHHFIALVFLVATSVLFLSAWMSSPIEDYLTLFIIFSIITLAAGYLRPGLPIGFRWLALIAIFVTICIVTDGQDVGISWMSILLCLFSWAIVLRRFIMERTENTIVASRSVMRSLYDYLDAVYRGFAETLDNMMKKDAFVPMIPVTHAVAIMSFSFLFMYIGMDSYESKFEEYGYAVYLGMMVLIPILYTIRNTRKGHGFLPSLLAAFVMFLLGAVAMFVCFVLAILAFISINGVITAISNLLKKLFG